LLMTPELDKSFNNILDCFSGADGCISFIHVKGFLEHLDKLATSEPSSIEGMAASDLVEIVNKFSRLIDVANNRE